MTGKVSLKKRAETVKVSLKKSGVIKEKVILRVAAALDISGSMRENFTSGRVSELVDRLLPVADQFDDNGEIDMWAFNNASMELPPATPENYGGYVEKELKGLGINGGTNYAPVIERIAHHYFGSENTVKRTVKPSIGFFGKLFGKTQVEEKIESVPITESDIPALVFFITDGANSDEAQAFHLMEKLKDEKVYWMMVGIGNASQFSFIESLARRYDNVGFINFKSLDLTDEQIYDSIINGELAAWINKVS